MFNFFGKNKKKKTHDNTDKFVNKKMEQSPSQGDNTTLGELKDSVSDNSEKIQDSISETLTTVKESVENTVENMQEVVSNTVENIQDSRNEEVSENDSPDKENDTEELVDVDNKDVKHDDSHDDKILNNVSDEDVSDIESNGIEPLFTYPDDQDTPVENTKEDDDQDTDDDHLENNDNQMQIDFNSDTHGQVESDVEEQEVLQEIAFDIKSLINNKSYPIILTIKDNDEDIKEELSSIIGDKTVFLVDLTESESGELILPESAQREYSPINNEGDSNYLDGIDIINLVKNSDNKYDGAFLVIAGIDNIADDIQNAFSGNQIAIDMINEKIATSIQEAVDNNITVIGTGYEFNDSLNEFIENLSIENFIEENEDIDNTTDVEENDDQLEENQDSMAPNTFTTFSIYVPSTNETIEQDVTSDQETIETWEDDGGNTVDEYLESMGEPSIEEGLEEKENNPFIDDNATEDK